MIIYLLPFIVWDAVWKGIALWKAARNNQLKWFVALIIINSLGVLPIIYLKFFQRKQTK
jgi:methionyl-tRNA synthetase